MALRHSLLLLPFLAIACGGSTVASIPKVDPVVQPAPQDNPFLDEEDGASDGDSEQAEPAEGEPAEDAKPADEGDKGEAPSGEKPDAKAEDAKPKAPPAPPPKTK